MAPANRGDLGPVKVCAQAQGVVVAVQVGEVDAADGSQLGEVVRLAVARGVGSRHVEGSVVLGRAPMPGLAGLQDQENTERQQQARGDHPNRTSVQ